MTHPMIERAARALAEAMGDDFDNAFVSKAEWINARGDKGGRFRDVNEPRQSDYIEGARAVIQSLRNPTEDMIEAGFEHCPTEHLSVWTAMLDAIDSTLTETPSGGE